MGREKGRGRPAAGSEVGSSAGRAPGVLRRGRAARVDVQRPPWPATGGRLPTAAARTAGSERAAQRQAGGQAGEEGDGPECVDDCQVARGERLRAVSEGGVGESG